MSDTLKVRDRKGTEAVITVADEKSAQFEGLCLIGIEDVATLYFDRIAVGLIIAQLQKIHGSMR